MWAEDDRDRYDEGVLDDGAGPRRRSAVHELAAGGARSRTALRISAEPGH